MARTDGERRVDAWIVPVLLAALVVVVPVLWGEAIVFRFGVVLIYLVAASGLHLLVNWAGDLSLAHGGLFGLSAFAVLAMSAVHDVSPVYLLPFGLVVGAVAGAVIAIPALRARGIQVALVTLVAGIAIDRFLLAQTWLVGDVPRTAAEVRVGSLHLDTSRATYPLLVIVSALCLIFVTLLYRSKVARGWFWTRASPDAAAAFGIPVVRYRILAYTVSGALAGVAGGLYAVWVPSFGRSAFPTSLSFAFLLIVVIGGHGVFRGVAVAAVMLQGGQQFATQIFGTDAAQVVDAIIVYGGPIGLIQVITKHPSGLTGVGDEIAHKLGLRRTRPMATTAASAHVVVPRSQPESEGTLA